MEREVNMKHYQTIYYRHRGAWTDKDSQRLNNLMNEVAKLGFRLVSTVNHSPSRDNASDETILLFFELDIPEKQ